MCRLMLFTSEYSNTADADFAPFFYIVWVHAHMHSQKKERNQQYQYTLLNSYIVIIHRDISQRVEKRSACTEFLSVPVT